MQHIHIAGERHHYCAWPQIIRTRENILVVSYCSSEEHLGPDGAIQIVQSRDNGKSWSSPIVARNSLIDDRDCGMTVLSDGRILLNAWSTYHTAKEYRSLPKEAYEADVIDHWVAQVSTREYKSAAGEHGGWTLVSDNNGESWKLNGRGPDSVHGGIELSSGDILVASYREEGPNIVVHRAQAADLQWQRLAEIATPVNSHRRFGEPHIVELASGRVLMAIRCTAIPYDDESPNNRIWLSYSDDGGSSWRDPFETPLLGFPPHLIKLSDNRVLMSYSYRRKPYGERACISEDGLKWDPKEEIILRDDADSHDLGYPSSIELEPGKILTVYYQSPHADPPARMNPPDPLRVKPNITGTIWNP